MKNNNKKLWVNVEKMVEEYAKETDLTLKDNMLSNIFDYMEAYTISCVNNAFENARNYGLVIPKADFESRFMQYLWESIEAYEIGGSTFKNIVIRRFRFAESHTWRQYRAKGDSSDKDGFTYDSARWDSLDRKVGSGDSDDDKSMADVVLGDSHSAEQQYLDDYDYDEILEDFSKLNERYSIIIRYMAAGYEGDDLAIVTGEAESNNAKMRKLVQRSKAAFKKYMHERKSR